LRLFLGAADALDAEGTLLHDPATAHGDVRRELVVEGRRPFGIIEVEDAHGVGTAVAAVADADAAAVNLAVESVRIVVTGIDRADRFAGGVVAVLAEDRQKAHPHVRILPHPEALDAQPLHVAPLADLLLAAERHVVLRLAGNHTGPAARATVEVDHHAPFIRTRLFFHE
jgi:hypothetical protein